MQYTIWYYRKCGINIETPITYIHPSVYFDSHDYSIANALDYIGLNVSDGVPHFEKPIEVGENSFVGANAILLPGTKIGKNSIIGSGAVVKGSFPDNSIIVGNPAKVIADTEEWVVKKWELKDWSTD